MNDPDWNHRLESAALAALEKMATTAAAAEGLLGQLAVGIFPTGVASLDQVTWPEVHGDGADGAASADPRAQAEARLRAAEARYRTLIEQIPAVTFMAVLGEGRNEVYVSPHIESMLGFTQEEWLGNPFLWYRQLHPDDRGLWYDEFARGCQAGHFKAECRFIARDGNTVWIHGEARLVRDEVGRPLFLQGIGFDITESKRAQEVLLNDAVRTAKAEEEMEIARRVQTSILPRDFSVPGLEIAATMIPASDVGGDYYEVLPAADGAWLAVGDVSGHGLNAGLVMLMVQSAIATLALERPGAPPREIFCRVNEVLYDNIRKRLGHDDHVTLSLFHYTQDGRFVFAGAHEELIVYRMAKEQIELVETPGTWLGAKRDIWDATPDSTLRLEDGDLLLLYTDGVTEARNAKGVQFDLPRLTAAVRRLRKEPCERIVARIVEEVRAWMSEQADDISLMALRYRRP